MVNSPLLPSSGSSSPPHGSGPSTSPPTTSLKSLDQLISNLPKGGFGHVAKRYFAVLALLALTTTLGFRLTKSSSEVQVSRRIPISKGREKTEERGGKRFPGSDRLGPRHCWAKTSVSLRALSGAWKVSQRF